MLPPLCLGGSRQSTTAPNQQIGKMTSSVSRAAGRALFRRSFLFPDQINWFPGHMAVARKQMQARIDQIDVLIEVRDARIPFLSANPVLDQLSFGNLQKPRLVVFNKSDLANSNMQQRVAKKLQQQQCDCLFTSVAKGKRIAGILQWCNAKSDAQFKTTAGTMVMVLGIPNVGKSSLINAFRTMSNSNKLSKGRKRAAVGPTPGVTVRSDIIKVNERPAVYVVDTPGVMMPNIPDVETGMKLALTGAIKDDIIGAEVIADYMLFLLNQMKSTRYVEFLNLPHATDDIDLMFQWVAQKCGAQGKDPVMRKQLAAKFLLNHFRQGNFGQFTLEHIEA